MQRKVWGYFCTALTTTDSEILTQYSEDIEWSLTPEPAVVIQKSLPRVEICTVMNVTIKVCANLSFT